MHFVHTLKMKLKKHVFNCDGNYEWVTDYLDCRLTFSDDLQRLQISKTNGDEIVEDYELYDLVVADHHSDSGTWLNTRFYNWRLSTGAVSAWVKVQSFYPRLDAWHVATENWDDDNQWEPINKIGSHYSIANNRNFWNEYVDIDGITTDEEWEKGTVAERILFMHKCGMLEVDEDLAT